MKLSLKNYIIEEYLTVREMRINGYEAKNYTNWIFASYMSTRSRLTRRTVASTWPSTRSRSSSSRTQRSTCSPRSCTQSTTSCSSKCDADEARDVIRTEDRATMIAISESSVDTVVSALMNEDFNFFLKQLPPDKNYERNVHQKNKIEDYRDALSTLLGAPTQLTTVRSCAKRCGRSLSTWPAACR